MFVHFRQQGRRLQASLMHTRRVAGKMHSEHIASLGSVDADVSVRERLAFWIAIEERLARLGNRVGPDDRDKIIAALCARIPFLTPDDLRGVQEENAKDDETAWGGIRDLNASGVEQHKSLIASAEKKIAEQTASAAEAAERAAVAKDRLERIKRGETVPSGLGKRLDFAKLMRKAGITPSLLKRAELLGSLTAEEFEGFLEKKHVGFEAMDKAMNREARQILRARRRALPAGGAIMMVRKSKHQDEFGSRGVEFAMASWDMQRTQSYVERGRQFENATDENLQALFVQAFRDWRANLWGDGRRSQVADVSAEYTLRGVDPPYALVEDDLLEIGSTVAADVMLLDEYVAAPKSRHLSRHFRMKAFVWPRSPGGSGRKSCRCSRPRPPRAAGPARERGVYGACAPGSAEPAHRARAPPTPCLGRNRRRR
jgi:hypothetical protein